MILQSDNGREFVNEVIPKVMSMWTDVVIVHGRQRHPQSQGSVERANQDVEIMLGNWMTEKKWVLGLHFVQLAKKHKKSHWSPFLTLHPSVWSDLQTWHCRLTNRPNHDG